MKWGGTRQSIDMRREEHLSPWQIGLLCARWSVQMPKELGRLHLQPNHDPHDVRQRQVALPPLNPTHVAPIDAYVIGKRFLRIAPGLALGAHPGTKDLQGILCDCSRLRTHPSMFGVRGLKHYGQ